MYNYNKSINTYLILEAVTLAYSIMMIMNTNFILLLSHYTLYMILYYTWYYKQGKLSVNNQINMYFLKIL